MRADNVREKEKSMKRRRMVHRKKRKIEPIVAEVESNPRKRRCRLHDGGEAGALSDARHDVGTGCAIIGSAGSVGIYNLRPRKPPGAVPYRGRTR